METKKNYRAEGTWGTCNWVLKKNGVLTIKEGHGVTIYDKNGIPESPWYSLKEEVKFIRTEGRVVLPEDSSFLFAHLFWAKYIDVRNFDTSHVKSMRGMFESCGISSMRPDFETSNVQDMSRMFSLCDNLKRLDLSRLDTQNCENMRGMFSECINLLHLDIRTWNVRKVRDMEGMFCMCKKLMPFHLDFEVDCVTSQNRDEWIEGMFHF